MRVVSGSARGTQLLSVPGDTTRPILDRVKTALFDILRPSLGEVRMLDMFAGTGAVGIEALSQGVKSCTFLDMAEAAVKTIRTNLERTHFKFGGVDDPAEVRHTDAFSYIRNTAKIFDLIYVAPPQYENLWVQAMQTIAERPDLISSRGRIIAQIDPSEYEVLQLEGFVEEQQRSYGKTMLVFFRKLT